MTTTQFEAGPTIKELEQQIATLERNMKEAEKRAVLRQRLYDLEHRYDQGPRQKPAFDIIAWRMPLAAILVIFALYMFWTKHSVFGVFAFIAGLAVFRIKDIQRWMEHN